MALKREIVIEVDDKGAIKSVDGLTDALDDNTKSLNENKGAQKSAEVSAEQFAASLEKQEARIKVLDGAINLVGGSIELFTGAMVLSGTVSEETAEKFESQAIGAIALADGAKRVFDGYKTLSEGLKTYGGVAGLAQKAQAALNTTVLANPYVAAAVAIAALGAAIYVFTREVDEAAEFQKKFDSAMDEATASTVAQTMAIETYSQIAQDGNRPIEDREFALSELAKQGVATEDIDLSNAESLQLLNERTAQAIPLVMARAKASAAAAILEEALKQQLEVQNSSLEDNLTWYEKTWSFIKGSAMPMGYEYQKVLDGAANYSENLAKETANVNRAQTSYSETLNELIALEGQNVTVQTTVREALERRAKTDASVKQALTDRANAEKEAIAIYQQAQLDLEVLRAEKGEKEIVAIEQAYAERIEKLKTYYGEESEAVKALEELKAAEIQAVRDAQQEVVDADEKEKADKLLALKQEIATAEAVSEEEKYNLRLESTRKYYDDLIAQAEEAGLATEELEAAKGEAILMEQEAWQNRSAEQEGQYRQALQDLAVDSAMSLLGDLSKLNSIYDKDNEAQAKKAFNREKALASVETVISTYLSAQKAYASQLSIPSPDAPVRAAIAAGVAIASGLARLAVINSQKFQSSGQASGGGGSAGGGGGVPSPVTAPQQGNSLTGLFPAPPTGQSSSSLPIQTYVLAGDVSSAQDANAKIQNIRKL